MSTPTRPLADYLHHDTVQTRWGDNDAYGHVNNVVFYAYFDTVINCLLISQGDLDVHHGAAIGLCVESSCRFVSPAAYPEVLTVGLRVTKLGRSSVRYELGVFRNGDEPCAEGHFVHVFVDRATRKPVELPKSIREALERIVVW